MNTFLVMLRRQLANKIFLNRQWAMQNNFWIFFCSAILILMTYCVYLSSQWCSRNDFVWSWCWVLVWCRDQKFSVLSVVHQSFPSFLCGIKSSLRNIWQVHLKSRHPSLATSSSAHHYVRIFQHKNKILNSTLFIFKARLCLSNFLILFSCLLRIPFGWYLHRHNINDNSIFF